MEDIGTSPTGVRDILHTRREEVQYPVMRGRNRSAAREGQPGKCRSVRCAGLAQYGADVLFNGFHRDTQLRCDLLVLQPLLDEPTNLRLAGRQLATLGGLVLRLRESAEDFGFHDRVTARSCDDRAREAGRVDVVLDE